MKEANEYQETPRHSNQYFNYEDKLDVAELDKIIDLAGKESAIDHNEIRELTKIILKIDPTELDESLTCKNQLNHEPKSKRNTPSQ